MNPEKFTNEDLPTSAQAMKELREAKEKERLKPVCNLKLIIVLPELILI